MSNPVARLGDAISHGGSITSASGSLLDGAGIARVGDSVVCALHGPQTITTGSPNFDLDGRKVARVTSVCSCGATIVSGSPTMECE